MCKGVAVYLMTAKIYGFENNENSTKRSVWVKDIYKKRIQRGYFSNLIQEMRLKDRENYYR